MTDKVLFDLDAAFAALERDERAARPAPSGDLVARVLGDAAAVAAENRPAPARSRAAASGGGWARLFGFADAWGVAAVATVLVFLVLGIGVGYEAGPGMLAGAGFGNPDVLIAEADDGLFSFEDAL
jgi:hypothetical protein